MADPAYWRAWRAAHPEYRERQNALRRARRARNGREDRKAEYAARPSRAIPPVPSLHQGHPAYVAARYIVGPRRGSLVELYDPLHDDLIAEAVLAIFDGRDPWEAVQQYGARERSYGRVTCPLIP